MFALTPKLLVKYHLLVALVIAAWLTVFLILIAPFDIADLTILERLEMMPLYGLISFLGYLILIPFQIWGHKKIKGYSISFEIIFILVFNLLLLLACYFYYKSGIIDGDYPFLSFTFEIYYPIFFILLPIIIFARWYVSKKIGSNISEKIIITGENKLDILQIATKDLICVSSADNYVTVAYLIKGELNKKLLRTTLKSIASQQYQLVKVHRSHIINPFHFKEWKDANTLLLTQMEVPVSKNYKKDILAMNHSPLKTDSSPLS